MSVTVAVIQAAPVLFRLEESLAKIERLTRESAEQKAGLVLFPESFLPAYPRGLDFGAVVGNRSEAGREQWLQYWQQSPTVPGEIVDVLGQTARKYGVYLCVGITERAIESHTLYCSLLYFDPEGRLIGRHRKLKPTGTERVIWGEGAGDDLKVHTTGAGRIGGLICWENYMPLARQALYEQKVEVYLAPTADARDSWQATLRHIACEGRCFVLGCNQYVTRDLYPPALQSFLPESPEVLCRGGSAIIDPYGRYLAGPVYDREDILLAELDPEQLIKSKLDFDVCGHYARPDVFDYRYRNFDLADN